jgi:threonine dehydrogenase-like Zn-dependent dehydrogenase
VTSKTIVFPAPLQVEMHEREVADPGPGEVLIQTLVSLVSTGTESWCFRGVFEENTSWANWVKYPFQPGYSNLGRLLAVGEGGGGYQVGDRVCTSLPHAQYGVVEARDITAKVPDPLSDEEASWGTLSYVTQTGVRRAQHRLADVVYDVTGHWAVLPLARQFGKVVLIGDSPEPTRQHLTQDVLARQVDVLGTHNAKLPPHDAEWTQSRQVALFYTYLVRGQMSMADLITHHFWPEQATEVYPMLQENRSATLGVIFDWRQDRHPAGP